MSDQSRPLGKSVKITLEIAIRLFIVGIIIAWCITILLPFLGPVIWGIILAVSIAPLYSRLNLMLGNKPKMASFIISSLFILVIIVPVYFITQSMVSGLMDIGSALRDGTLQIPPPTDRVKEWPLIGERAATAWTAISENLSGAIQTYKTELEGLGKWILGTISSLMIDLALIIVSIIISGILLATQGTKEVYEKLFVKIAGKQGHELAKMTEKTIGNVTKGIIGVALIQSVLLGLIFFLAGVPYAGILALLALILGIIQLPPTLVSIPVIVYLYSSTGGGMATFWTILLIAASLSDNILKPIFLGKGASVPMLVIFIGSIGGFILSGLIGLFTGAVVLSIGYKLFMAWLNDPSSDQLSSTSKSPSP